MDRIEPGRETEEPDGAEAAFEALRREVAALRYCVELVYRQGEDAKLSAANTDYSPTLGDISKDLKDVRAWLKVIEAKPGLTITPAALNTQISQVGEESRLDLNRTQGQLKMAVRDIEALAGQVRTRKAQRNGLIATGVLGALVGVFLWIVLIKAVLPAGVGARLAALPIGGGPWHAGQVLMGEAWPAGWDRMVRLYNACPADTVVEKCEAAMTAPVSAPATEPAKASNSSTVLAAPHARTGR